MQLNNEFSIMYLEVEKMNNFRKYRQLSGLKVVEAAKKLEITNVYLHYIESGIRKPSRDLLFKICKLYNCKVEDIFFA